ncbi:MAG TPA: ester cyclase [Polyangiaceae bacterium]
MGMRKLCLVGLAMGMFACGGQDASAPPPAAPPPPPAPAPVDTTPAPVATAAPAPAPSKSDKILATLKEMGDAINAHDAAKISSGYAKDCVVKMAGTPDATGRDGVQLHMAEIFTMAPDAKSGARRVWVKDNNAVVEWTNTGTNTGESHFGKPTGKAFGFNGASAFTFNDDGKITEEHVYFDVPTLMQQLGVGPKMAGPAHPVAKLPDGAPEVHLAKGTPAEDANVASAKAMNRTFEKGDVKAFLDGLAEDVSYDDVTMPAPMTGKKQAEGFYVAFSKAFPQPKITEANVYGVDDYTIDEWTMDATQKAPLSMGPGMTVPNTKKAINTHTLEIVQWKDGKLAKGWAYDNGMEMAMQLGLVKPPKGKAEAKPGAAAGKKEDTKAEAPKGDAAKKDKPAK